MPYQGGKSQPGAYHTLINLIPPHRVFIEAYLGGGAIMRYKRPAEMNIGIDLDEAVIRQWNAASTSGGATGARGAVELPRVDRHAVKLPGTAASGGNGVARRRSVESPIAAARGGSAEDAGGIGVSAERARYQFLCTDAQRFLKSYRFTGGEFIYADPPYLISARSSCNENYYRYEMSDLQHRDLLRLLRQLKCNVMISGYSSHLYDTLLKGWNVATYTAWTHRHEPRTEHVWFNYPAPVALHDYRYLGSNYRERQDIRRQQMRWKGKLEKMPLIKRQALLSAIVSLGVSA